MKVTSDKVGRNAALEIRRRFVVLKKGGGVSKRGRSVPIFPAPRTQFEKGKKKRRKTRPSAPGDGVQSRALLPRIYLFLSSALPLCCRFPPSPVETQRWRPASFPQTSSFQKIFKNI